MPLELTAAFETLPGCNDDPFRYLWETKRLRFSEDEQSPDIIDEFSARLVCAALSNRQSLFITLPDYQPHRPAFLFTTALIRHACDVHDSDVNEHLALYCGSTIGIREQLRLTRVKGANLNLADAFRQQNLSKGEKLKSVYRKNTNKYALKIKKKALGWTIGVSHAGKFTAISQLPRVVTAYAPSDPVTLIDQYRPKWIALDIDEVRSAIWLPPLLEEAARQQIPVIAWGQNPLSECVGVFSKYGHVFVWRPHIYTCVRETSNESSVLPSISTTQVQPYILEGNNVDLFSAKIKEAYQQLNEGWQYSPGPHGRDALRIHWQYLRTLESLFVPLDFYESEAPHYWGIKSLEHLKACCERFKDSCHQSYPQFALKLEQAFTSCEQAFELLKQGVPPLWGALCNLCITEPPDNEARLIIFSGQGKKQLFLLALLAYHNISDADLKGLRTWVLTLEELRRLVRHRSIYKHTNEDVTPVSVDTSLEWHPILLGLPSPYLTPKLLPVLLHTTIDVILYPHQAGAMKRRNDEWEQAMAPDSTSLLHVLNRLSQQPLSRVPSRNTPRLILKHPLGLNSHNAERRIRPHVDVLWPSIDPVDEIAKLLQTDEEGFNEDSLLQETLKVDRDSDQDEWCDTVVEVIFTNNTQITFAPDELINVVKTGNSGVEERYVRSLRTGDRVVLIHNQQRQSLYGLLISRVHQHPSMMLHLALVERWKIDFLNAYQRWRRRGAPNLDELRKRLNERGSRITSTAALRAWLQGEILCPQDGKDLQRLADVLDIDYVRQHYKRIERAATRLRSLHRVLSNKLNRWLKQQATGIDAGSDEDVIDKELGLTFGDLRSSLLMVHVKDVQVIHGLFLRSNLGRLEG